MEQGRYSLLPVKAGEIYEGQQYFDPGCALFEKTF